MAEKILIADDDPDVALFVEINLQESGYEIALASDGEEALRKAHDLRPDLVVLDVMMPKLDGIAVLEQLRADPRTHTTNVIMLTGRVASADKVLGITSGADDYLIKPFDPVELVARVKSILHRSREMRSVSPLTGLPGNVRIHVELDRLIKGGLPFALLYIDLDSFKAFNDRYGFLRGDEALRTAANVILTAVLDHTPDAFVGHVGGDDFVAICEPSHAEEVCRLVVERFDAAVPGLLEPEDLARGFIEVPDRQGTLRRHSLPALSIGVATTDRRRFEHAGAAVTVATEMKEFAKRTTGSSWAIDRRGASIQLP